MGYQPVAMGRQHIVKPIPDHKETYQAAVEEWEEENVKETESSSHYKNLAPKRPVCQKLIDHTEEIQPKSEESDETSEYRSTINNLEDKIEGMTLKGERALPPWLNMQKVTPFGTNQDVTRE